MCLLKNEAHVANYFTFKVKGTNVCCPQQNNFCTVLSRNPDAIKKIIRKPFTGSSQDIVYEINKDYTSLSLCIFPNLRYSSNYFEQIYRAQHSSMSRTAITLKFKTSLLFGK